MNRSLLPATFFLASQIATAQTITQDDMPYDGLSFQFVTANYVPITATGANVTWDLSTLTPGDITVTDIALPAASGYADEFPTASLVLLIPNIQQFIRIDGTGMYFQGLWNGYSNVLAKFTDEELSIPFPCAYNTTFSDPFAGGYDVGPDHVDVTGNCSYTADGYGTVILPWGTVTNVLKLTGTEIEDEMYQGDDYGNYSQVVVFYKPGLRFYLLKSLDYTTSLNDEPTGNFQVLNYMSQNSVGVEEALRNDIGVDVFPMPAHDRLNVTYALDGGQATTLTLRDEAGRTVRTLGSITGATGLQCAELDVAGLPAGLYFLEVTDGRGQRGTRKVVLQ